MILIGCERGRVEQVSTRSRRERRGKTDPSYNVTARVDAELDDKLSRLLAIGGKGKTVH